MQMRLAITIFYNSPTARTGRWKLLSVTRTNQGGYEPLLILYPRCSVTINVKFKTLSRNWFRIRVFVLTSEFGRTSWEDRCFWIKIQDTIDNQKVLENRLRESQTVVRLVPQGPHSQILMTVGGGGGGGSDRGSYFIPQKITSSEFVYPKKSLSPFFATQKIPLFFFPTQINHGVFHRPKTVTFGQNFRPKKITRTPPLPPAPLPSLKYVSAAPGTSTSLTVLLRKL